MWLTGRVRYQRPGPERKRSVARAEVVRASDERATAFAAPVDPEVWRMRAGEGPSPRQRAGSASAMDPVREVGRRRIDSPARARSIASGAVLGSALPRAQ